MRKPTPEYGVAPAGKGGKARSPYANGQILEPTWISPERPDAVGINPQRLKRYKQNAITGDKRLTLDRRSVN
jgi:hypothetical protein